ncbi:aminotransferase class V-fold PLP-dependent enzyme [Tumidithrix elongata RA019]|uniref:Aminotransferase class V-fold PLP-dependent enzyme n=1 Tax=Tumidithrix elongata BACA0141 TaxID=2716417 RepID=A0AAW9PZN9_9CYAN|nr:aminotransferase class V-fold PLP-dependent enzyme [Tumidithrix elongata RA019]
MLNQDTAPLFDAVKAYLKVDHAPFYMPGHKRGQGIDPEFAALLGENLFRLDLPELPGLDRAIAAAEDLAAEAYGADRTWFLVNGSTCGIEAMVLAACQTGDKILLGRNCHKAAIAALILSGAVPIYLETEYNAKFDLDCGVSPHTVKQALLAHPDAKAVLIVSPNYYGVCGDIEKIAAIAHAHHVPLLVDAAHGAHLSFHSDLPIAALQAGADLVVQSTHKVTSGLTQASMLHLQGDSIASDRVSQALQLVQSTSPNLMLLTSLDVARRQMALHGCELLDRTIALANQARSQISQIQGFSTFDQSQVPTLDPTRLTVMVDTHLGLTGFDVDTMLHSSLEVMPEMPTLTQLVFILSLGNREADIERLVTGLQQISESERSSAIGYQLHDPNRFDPHRLAPIVRITPREAFFAQRDRLLFAAAIGRISTELVCPYPPGIPILCPGEEITVDVVAYLQRVKQAGGIMNGCSDLSLETIQVVR